MLRFLHLADLHLGYQQYGLPERTRDFAAAFGRAVRQALEVKPDFVLVAGDFFHHRQVDALTLRQAILALDGLRQAGIPVLTVAGNHDLGWRDGTESWLTLLHHLELVRHLDLDPRAERLLPDAGARPGPLYETECARVIGLPYLGASLPRLLPRLAEELRELPRKYTVLMLHAGLEGTIPGVTEPLRPEHLAALAGLVDYVALGHRHKPFCRPSVSPPLYNPGSLEAAAADESEEPGGWFVAQVETQGEDGWHQSVTHSICPRRPFHRLRLDCTYLHSPAELQQALQAELAALPPTGKRRPIVELRLVGTLLFSQAALDLDALTARVEDSTQALKVLVRNQAAPSQGPTTPGEGLTRAALEQQVLVQAISQDYRYRERAPELAGLAAEVKQLALTGATEEDVFEHVAAAVEGAGE